MPLFFWLDLFLEASAIIITKSLSRFWSIWRHQKDISKLTDLYKCFMANRISTQIQLATSKWLWFHCELLSEYYIDAPINDRKLPRQQARGSKMPIFKSKTRNVRTISQQKKRLQSVEVHISRAVSVLVWALKQKDICLVYIVLLCMCQMRSILMRRKKPAAIRNIRWYLLGTSEPHEPT